MKTLNLKKLAGYSATAASLFSLHTAKAQIVYTDPDPDIDLSFGGEYVELDLNDDAIMDFGFEFTTNYEGACCGTDRSANIIPLGSNAAAYNLIYTESACSSNFFSFQAASALDAGAVINNLLSFENNPLIFSHFDVLFSSCNVKAGNWDDESHFAGLRFHAADGIHFGWVRITTDGDYNGPDHLVISDYAYNNTPGASLFAGETLSCDAPVIIAAIPLTPTSAKLKWMPVEAAVKYMLRYKKTGTSGWTTKTVNAPATSKVISGLSCDTEYTYQVRSLCSDGSVSPYSTAETFSTPACRTGNELSGNDAAIMLYPNPAADKIYLEIAGFSDERMQITVTDLNGRDVMHFIPTSEPLTELDIHALPAGVYVLHLQNGETDLHRQFVKE